MLKEQSRSGRKRKYRCEGRFETDSIVLHGPSAGGHLGNCVCSSPGTNEHARTIPRGNGAIATGWRFAAQPGSSASGRDNEWKVVITGRADGPNQPHRSE